MDTQHKHSLENSHMKMIKSVGSALLLPQMPLSLSYSFLFLVGNNLPRIRTSEPARRLNIQLLKLPIQISFN